MRFPQFTRSLVIPTLVYAMVVGCNKPSQPLMTGSPLPFAFHQLSPHAAAEVGGIAPRQIKPMSPWTAPDRQGEDLIYVSTLQSVAIYTYPKGKRAGSIGLSYANGECTDESGDVFIADGDSVLEYKHGGKRPIKTLTLSGYEAVACAGDPTTGNLAVTWYGSTGYVAVYAHASGAPTLYQYVSDYPRSCGYDDKGDLFVDGEPNHGYGFMLEELPSGANRFENITLGQSIKPSGAVQWDGRYMTVQDIDANKIYRFISSGSTGIIKGTVTLVESPSQFAPGVTWIAGNRVLEPNGELVNNQPLGVVAYFKYPEGGSSTKTISVGYDTAPCCLTVSKAVP